MAVATINGNYKRVGAGVVKLIDYPTTLAGNPTALKDVAAAYLALLPSSPYLNLEASGISIKVKQNCSTFDPQNGPKERVGIIDTSIEFELSFADCDVAHWDDILSATTAETLTMAAATGKAGRTGIAIGGQTYLNNYTLFYEMPALNKTAAGEFDYIILNKINFVVDTEFKGSKNDVVTVKIKGECLADYFSLNPDTNRYEMAYYLDATAKRL